MEDSPASRSGKTRDPEVSMVIRSCSPYRFALLGLAPFAFACDGTTAADVADTRVEDTGDTRDTDDQQLRPCEDRVASTGRGSRRLRRSCASARRSLQYRCNAGSQ